MPTAAPVRVILAKQAERTRHSSKADIKRFIEESEQKITSLKSQISTLWDCERSGVDASQETASQIDTLVELRDRERACVASLRYIISPIRTLPVELLAEIFELAINDETHVEDIYRISQICSEWRMIAHATPRLWTRSIRVKLETEEISGRKHYANGLEAWWARSAPLPVSVSLELVRGNIDPRILEHVLSIAPRIRLLSYAAHLPLSLIGRLAECRLDSLEELQVGLPYGYLSTFEPPLLTMAPRLRKLAMIVHPAGPLVVIPLWTQLTDLALDSNSLDIIFDIMAQCTALIRATVRTSGWYVDAAAAQLTPRASLAFCHLHILRLDFGTSKHLTHFLGSVSAPALEELHLNFLKMQGFMQSAPFTAFLMQSPNITRLEILYGLQGPTSRELLVALRLTMRLTHLSLACPSRHCFDDALIDALSYKHDVAPLVPHLHHLVLNNINEDGFAMDALKRMLLSRWWADAPLTSGSPAVARWSHLGLWGKYSGKFMNSMEILQCMGLPLELSK